MSKKDEDKELLDTLEGIFLQEGHRNVTFRKLSARLGCSNRKLYSIAPSKEALFLNVINRFFSRIKKQGWETARSGKPLADRIRDYQKVGIDAALKSSSHFNTDIDSMESGRVLFDEFQEERISGLRLLIEEGIESGEFEGFHSQLVAEVMIAAVKHIRDPQFLAKSGISFAEGLTELSKLLRHGLLAR